MAKRDVLTRAARIAAILGLGFSLIGCEGLRQATGAAKLPPDEFTVLTKAPLIIPPEYPYPLPGPWPEPLASFRASLAGHRAYAWASEMYRRHRGTSAEITS